MNFSTSIRLYVGVISLSSGLISLYLILIRRSLTTNLHLNGNEHKATYWRNLPISSLNYKENQTVAEFPAIVNISFIKRAVDGSNCISGHVIGMPPVCGENGCLRQLKDPGTSKSRTFTYTRDQLRNITDIDGFLMGTLIHTYLVSNITQMQRHFGVYGSVGEIGVFHGKYSSILALNTDVISGERFFIGDLFGKIESGSVGFGDFKKVLKHLELVGFSTNPKDDRYKVYVWYDNSMWLSKTLFLRLDIPAFRLLSIDGAHTRPIVLNDFEKAACIMRRGGVLIFDDVRYRWEPEVDQGIQDFFFLYGYTSFKPFLLLTNKLFVCSSDYHGRFIQYIRDSNMIRYFKLKEMNNSLYHNFKDVYFTNIHY